MRNFGASTSETINNFGRVINIALLTIPTCLFGGGVIYSEPAAPTEIELQPVVVLHDHLDQVPESTFSVFRTASGEFVLPARSFDRSVIDLR